MPNRTYVYTYSPPGNYDDELIVPMETLRAFAAAQRESRNIRYIWAVAELARIALVEKGWENTPEEGKTYFGFDAFHLICDCLEKKDDFAPEEQKVIAAALRNMGRFAHRSPRSIGPGEYPQQGSSQGRQ
ncbi:MAG: hypothetical protein J0M07_01320 [Anaerolineae bacterium]|nr:hypothetical protein [Anaerolineae bacterium]